MKIAPIILLAITASGGFTRSEYQPIDVRPLRDKISVRMHQTITYAFEQRGDRLVNPRVVHERQKKPTVTVELTDEAPGMSTLVITSTYPKMLHYRGAAHFRGKPGFLTTAAYAVHPNAPDAEGFQDGIDEFVLWDLRLTNERK